MKKVPIDFAIAVVLALSAMFASFSIYPSFVGPKSQGRVVSFEMGSQHYRASLGSVCFGDLNYKFESAEQSYDLSISAAFRLKDRSRTIKGEGSAKMSFSRFGQLTETHGDFFIDGKHYQFATLGINPIEVKIRPKSPDRAPTSFEVPGPVEVRKVKGTTWALYYESIFQFIEGSSQNSLIIPKLDLKFTEASSAACSERNVLDITPFVDMVSPFAQKLLSLQDEGLI